MGDLDTNLIREFENLPALYNKNIGNYKDKLYTEQAWQSISMKLGYPVSDLKDRMYQLRNRYNLEKRKLEVLRNDGIEPIPAWSLYQQLTFLDGHIRPRKSYKSMMTKGVDELDDRYYEMSPMMSQNVSGESNQNAPMGNNRELQQMDASLNNNSTLPLSIPNVIIGTGAGSVGGTTLTTTVVPTITVSAGRGRPRKSIINPIIDRTIHRTSRRGRPPKRLIECDDGGEHQRKFNAINNKLNLKYQQQMRQSRQHHQQHLPQNHFNDQTGSPHALVEVKIEPVDDTINENNVGQISVANENNTNNTSHDTSNKLINGVDPNNRNNTNKNSGNVVVHNDNAKNNPMNATTNSNNVANNKRGNDSMVQTRSNGNVGGNNSAILTETTGKDGHTGGGGGGGGVVGGTGVVGTGATIAGGNIGSDMESSNDTVTRNDNEYDNTAAEFINPVHFLVDSESDPERLNELPHRNRYQQQQQQLILKHRQQNNNSRSSRNMVFNVRKNLKRSSGTAFDNDIGNNLNYRQQQQQQQQQQHQHHRHQYYENRPDKHGRQYSPFIVTPTLQSFPPPLAQHQQQPTQPSQMPQQPLLQPQQQVQTSLPTNEKFERFGNFISASLADLPDTIAYELMEKIASDVIKALIQKSKSNNPNTTTTTTTTTTIGGSRSSASSSSGSSNGCMENNATIVTAAVVTTVTTNDEAKSNEKVNDNVPTTGTNSEINNTASTLPIATTTTTTTADDTTNSNNINNDNGTTNTATNTNIQNKIKI